MQMNIWRHVELYVIMPTDKWKKITLQSYVNRCKHIVLKDEKGHFGKMPLWLDFQNHWGKKIFSSFHTLAAVWNRDLAVDDKTFYGKHFTKTICVIVFALESETWTTHHNVFELISTR